MIKKLLLLFMCLFLVGCKPLQKMDIDEVIENGTKRTLKVYNKYRRGYKYNLPKGLEVSDNKFYNEIIHSNQYTYYLYVDAVSFYNKVIEKYEINKDAYISKQINYQDKYGYLEVNEQKNGKYFIEIMYNYAKIEVIVNKNDINVVVSNALSILTSIKFNDNVLKNLLYEETSLFKEYQFDIFETTKEVESSYLQAVEEDEEKKDEIHDIDLID